VLVVFTDVATPPETKAAGKAPRASARSDGLASLERELQQAREEVQTCREEMQTSQEELKSTNEELQSANEELQSTNEELTTSKEEMQSLNEELQTVNHELQAKVDELSQANNDMKNLLNSTDIATLFLDEALHVRRFTPQATRIIKLIPGDAVALMLGEHATKILCHPTQASKRFRPDARVLIPRHLEQPFALFPRENTDWRDAGRHDTLDSVFFGLTEPWVRRQPAPAHSSTETETIQQLRFILGHSGPQQLRVPARRRCLKSGQQPNHFEQACFSMLTRAGRHMLPLT